MSIGSFQHRALPTRPIRSSEHRRPRRCRSRPRISRAPWKTAVELLPRIGPVGVADAFGGVFSFADGYPLIGESLEARGYWVAESVWITHSIGVAGALAEWIASRGSPAVDVHEADVHRFEPFQRSTAYFVPRSITNHDGVYDVHHPLEPVHRPRPMRTSPWIERQREAQTVFVEGRVGATGVVRGQRRPRRPGGLEIATRDDWHARWWSPIAVAEHAATRRGVGVFDLTPLRRVSGSGSRSTRVAGGVEQRRPRSAAKLGRCALVLGPRGTVLTDAIVSRLAPDRWSWASARLPTWRCCAARGLRRRIDRRARRDDGDVRAH